MSDCKASASSNDRLSSIHDDSVEDHNQKKTLDFNGKSKIKHEPIASPNKGAIDPFGEPPDGGLNAWLKVLGCFLIYSNIWYMAIVEAAGSCKMLTIN